MLKTFYILLLFILVSTVSNAGWYFVYMQKTAINEKKIEVYIQNSWIKISSEEKDVIFESKSQTLTIVSHKTKNCWTGNIKEFDDIQETALKLSSTAFISTLDSINKAKLDLWMLPIEGKSKTLMYKLPDVYSISTNKSENFLKYKATKQSIYANEKLVESIWIAPSATVFKDIDLKKFLSTLLLIEIPINTGYEFTDAFFSIVNKGLLCKREQFLNYKNGSSSQITHELESAVEDEFQDNIFRKPEKYSDINLFDLLSFLYTNELERKLEL